MPKNRPKKLERLPTKREEDILKSISLHQNFKNLNPIYDKLRYERAQKLAERWKTELGQKLVAQVNQQMRDDFHKFIVAGNKLTFAEIQGLSAEFKNDYIAQQLKENELVKQHSECIGQIALQNEDEIVQMVMNLTDT